ncbi:MAG: histidine kinase [Flavobacteriales bacterium]
MFNLRFLVAILLLFLTCATNAQTEELLRKEIQKTKDKTSHLQARLHLLTFLEETNKAAWIKELKIIEDQAPVYSKRNDQKTIALLLCERALYLGASNEAAEIFQSNLSNFIFSDKQLEWRRKILMYVFSASASEQNFKSLLAYSRRFLKNKETAQLYQIQAAKYLGFGQIDSALVCSEQSVQIAKRSAGNWVLINALQAQAEVLWQANLLDQAVQRSIFSLQLAEEAQLPYFKIRPLILIAAISLEVGNAEQTFAYAKRAQNLALQFQDEFYQAFASLILSEHYLQIQQTSKATNNLRFALHYFKKINNLEAIHRATLCQATISAALDQDAQPYFIELEQNIGRHAHSMLADKFHLEYGKYFLKKKQYQLAENHFKSILDRIHSSDQIRPQNAVAFALIAKIEAQKGNHRAAMKYQQAYSDWLAKSPVWRSAARIEEMSSSNLREERERLIDFQRASIEKVQKERKIIELQKDRQLFISIIFIVAIIFGVVIFILRIQQNRIKQEQREAELSQTLLRTQMNPHFVFNAMSVIQSYIYENDPEKSSQFLVKFSRLMRLILENSPKEFIPIELEIEILDKYLATQKMRFENRFDYTLDISDDLLFNKAMVPPMITQPFIENSIEHGQLHTVKDGHIIVQMRADGNALFLTIEDNGVGRKKSERTKKIRTHKSMAIDITKERIEIINKKYKFNGSLDFEDLNKEEQTGTIVKLVLPLRYEDSI